LTKFSKILGKLVDFTLGKQKRFPIYTRTWDPFCFLGYLSHGTDLFTYLPPLSTQQPSLNQERRERGGPLGGLACPPELSCPGEAHSQFKINKYDLKKSRDFTVSEGHEYPLVYHI